MKSVAAEKTCSKGRILSKMPNMFSPANQIFVGSIPIHIANKFYKEQGRFIEVADGMPYQTGVDKPYSKEYQEYLNGISDPRD